jgi:parvulin-like peptidyl-prolyl isomerase
MSKLVQRIVALVVMLAVVMSATAYGASTFVVDYQELKSDAPVVMTVNGEEIHADEYASYMMSQIINYQQMYSMYGLSEENMASTFGDAAKESAKQQVALIHIVKQKMDELGLSLSYSQKKNIVTANKQNAEQLGGEDAYLQRLASIGFDMDNYNNYQYVSACAQALKDYYFGENGVNVPSDDELQKYFDDNYITAKHILILTTNPSTGETTRTDEEAKKEAQAVLDRLNNGEDFDALLTEKNEDAGEAQYAKGYTFTEGQMVDEFYNAAKALQEGEVSGLVKSKYGYHIIKRCELNQDEFENMRDAIIAAVASEKGTAGSIDEMMQQWIDEADIQTTDAYDEITYNNTKDYLPADVQAVLNSNVSDDDGNAQTEDAQSEDQTSTDSQTATDEAQTATTESAQ